MLEERIREIVKTITYDCKVCVDFECNLCTVKHTAKILQAFNAHVDGVVVEFELPDTPTGFTLKNVFNEIVQTTKEAIKKGEG